MVHNVMLGDDSFGITAVVHCLNEHKTQNGKYPDELIFTSDQFKHLTLELATLNTLFSVPNGVIKDTIYGVPFRVMTSDEAAPDDDASLFDNRVVRRMQKITT